MKVIVILGAFSAICFGCGSGNTEGAETAKPAGTSSTPTTPAPTTPAPAPTTPMGTGGAPAPQENAGGTAIKANELGPQ
jgi:hypothetical protein